MAAAATTLRGSWRSKTASELREIGDKSLILSPILVFEHELNELNEFMKIITHENLWWWGKSYTLILDNGKAMIEVSIEDERPDAACIQSLLVHESVRQQGIANAMLTFAEDKAKKAGCEQVYLCARKGTFLIPWYERRGYKIYDENPEYSKGQTVAMNKYFEDEKEGEK